MSSPCAWPVDRSCLPAAESEIDIAKQTAAENMAVAVLWALSGRQFGVCPVITRPCPTPCLGLLDVGELVGGLGPWTSGPGWLPLWDGSNWRNVGCACGNGSCSISGPSIIHLPGPVVAVTAVTVEGVDMEEVDYVLEGELLYRTGGGDWPTQNLTRPLGESGTWSVAYDLGIPPPAGAGVLVGVLTKEFLAACSGGKCRLPRQVQTLSRKGVSYQMIDPIPLIAAGLTGIPEIDLWLHSVNPNRLMSAPRVR